MRKKISEQLAAGERCGLFLGGSGGFLPTLASTSLRGEVVLSLKESAPSGGAFELQGLGLTSRGLLTEKGFTGKLGIQFDFGGGLLSQGAAGHWRINGVLTAKVLYRAVEEALGFNEERPGILVPSFETFIGSLAVDLVEEDGGELPNRLVPVPGAGSLVLLYKEGGLGWIETLVVPVADLALWASGAKPVPSTCPKERSCIRRTLKVRPIGLKNGLKDPSPTGAFWAQQRSAAMAIWGQCCVDLDAPKVPELVDVGDLKSSTDLKALKGAVEDKDKDEILVFMVDASPPHGGGSVGSAGTNLATVLIADQTAGNAFLLAHELGHVLGLGDAGVGGNPGVAGSVMDPSGSADDSNPNVNKLGNCQHMNPALIPGVACCFTAP